MPSNLQYLGRGFYHNRFCDLNTMAIHVRGYIGYVCVRVYIYICIYIYIYVCICKYLEISYVYTYIENRIAVAHHGIVSYKLQPA